VELGDGCVVVEVGQGADDDVGGVTGVGVDLDVEPVDDLKPLPASRR
jgi:hypothetical protein